MTDWDRRYREVEHTNETPHPLVTQFASGITPGRALDVACGAGRHALWLAQHGWDVTAVDNSRVGLQILRQRAENKGVHVRTIAADLEAHEFVIEPEAYDLIVICNYLQRGLFPSICEGVRLGGIVIAVIAMTDDDPEVKPMNPAFLLNPGELRAEFNEWVVYHDVEGRPAANPQGRATAQLVARKQQREVFSSGCASLKYCRTQGVVEGRSSR